MATGRRTHAHSGETLIDHRWDDGFIDTDLAGELEAAEAGQLWLAGLGSTTA
jgi:hypothetical protein